MCPQDLPGRQLNDPVLGRATAAIGLDDDRPIRLDAAGDHSRYCLLINGSDLDDASRRLSRRDDLERFLLEVTTRTTDSGLLAGAIDVSTTEVADEIVGGVLSAGPNRLDVFARGVRTYAAFFGKVGRP